MRTSGSGSRSSNGGPGDRRAQVGTDGFAGRHHGRLFRLTAGGLATSVVAGMLSVIAVAASITATPQIAGATTTGIAATWSSGTNCTSYVTSTPPAGTVSATLTLSGGGGGGGGTNSGSGGSGGAGGEINGTTLALTHNLGIVSVKLGCGGSHGSNGGIDTTINGGAGGAGYAAGATGGDGSSSGSVDGESSAGGGGGASGLCLGNGTCSTAVAVAGGGGGGGARWDCTGSTGPGAGGSGGTSGTSSTSAGSGGSNGDGSDGTGGGGGTSSGGGGGGSGYSHSGSAGSNTPYSSAGGAGGNGNGGEAGAGGGGGGGGYTGGGGAGGDDCVTGSAAGGGGGGGSSAVNSSYASAFAYTTGASGGGSEANGTSGSVTLTWNVDNLSVTNPGTQSNVSGSAISTLTIAAPHDTTGGNSVTFAATGLPAGLSINSSTGAVTGTPTTACACSVTVTATDSQALPASTTFTWNITNTVTVANPGNQSAVTGTAITAVPNSATDTQSGATLTWSVTGLPGGLSINSSSGTVTGTPTTPCTCAVTLKATDGAGYSGTASLTWTVTNTVSVANPGNKSAVTGTAITAVPNSATDTQSGATLTWSATGLPGGLSINSSSGTVTGTPTTPCTCAVTLKATDGAGYSGTASLTWTVTNTVSVANPGNHANSTGAAITPVTDSATDSQSGVSSYTWSATGLPAGLSINSSTGTVTGTPTTPCTCSVTLTATDPSNQSGTATFTWTITNTVTVANPGNTSAVTGTAITAVTSSATDSESGITSFTWSATGLPAGLSINSSTGTISGTPTAPCTCSVTLTATDSTGASGSATFTWTVANTVSVANPGSQGDVTGSAITPVTDSATDSQSGVSSYTWSATGLPAGLSINSSTGTVTGTPTTPCTCSVTLTATDPSNQSGTATFTWTITNTVTVANPGDQDGTSGTAIATLTSSAADTQSGATVTWSATGLPAGLSIDPSTGDVTGTPTAGGTSSVTVTATDGAGFSGSATFSWSIANTVTVTGQGAQTSASGTPITGLPDTATDSQAGETFTWSATGLPAGLSIDGSSGTITGTPTTAGVSSVTVTATDGAGFSGTTSFSWTVTNQIAVTNPGSQSDVSGAAVTPLDAAATDSSPGAVLSFGATGLPAGLSVDPATGDITGTPTTACTCSVTLTATDGSGATDSATFTWTITNTVAAANPGDQSDLSGSTIAPITDSATDSSSTATVTWSATGLPDGLSIDAASGDITGTPTTAGTSSVTVTATDDAGYSSSASFTWTVTNSLSVASPGDQSDLSGSSITPVDVAASDSSTTATLTYTATGLPDGLSIDAASGDITGTPTTAGTSSVTVTVTDDAGYSGSATFSWVISNTLALANPGAQTDDSGTAITPVDLSATDTSPAATLTYADGGTLPAGLTLDGGTGVISGTPTTGGTDTVTLTVSDGTGATATVTVTWTITNVITTPTTGDQSDVSGTPIATVDTSATDSSPVATLSYTDSGTLPPGLSVDPSTGAVTGTPTTGGTFAVTITASDDAGFSATDTFTWVVTDVLAATGPGDQSSVSGSAVTPVSASATDTSSTATVTWSDGGTLPPGLSVDPTAGTVSGTPTTAGTYAVFLTATDGAGYAATTSFTWTITNVVTAAVVGDQASVSGSAITPLPAAATDTSSTATVGYSDGGTLPPGLAVDPVAGTISGTPTTAGTYAVTITATDSAGYSATSSFTWTVTNIVTVTAPPTPTATTGSPITPLTLPVTDSSSTATIVSWSATNLPPGLSFDDTTGTITGTPTTAGDYIHIMITATDSAGFTGTAHFPWKISNLVTVSPIADQTTDTFAAATPVSPTVTDSQISPPVTITWTANGLPQGIAIDHASGVLSGTPTVAGSYPVTVTATDNAVPQQSGSVTFTWNVVALAPVITGLSPDSGPGAGGINVLIDGANFQDTTSVLFGSTPATIKGVNSAGTQVTVLSPPHATGTVDVAVTSQGLTSSTSSADQYTFLGPVITSLSVTTGPTVGGAKLKIRGADLAGATSVTFGSTPATDVKASKGGQQITLVVPAHAVGSVTVTVTTPGGTSEATTADQYTYEGPTVTSVSPHSGPPAGGTQVSIHGKYLTGATSVSFGTTTVTSITVNKAGTTITATAPAGGAGTVDITVTTPGATSAVVAADHYTYT